MPDCVCVQVQPTTQYAAAPGATQYYYQPQ